MNTFLEQSQDTVIRTDLGYFQSKVHVQTTSDKVVKSTYNDNGVEVDNIYLDNVASLRLYNHGTPVFAHDFRKQEFQSLIPKSFLSRSILRKMYFTHADAKALYYYVIIGIPWCRHNIRYRTEGDAWWKNDQEAKVILIAMKG